MEMSRRLMLALTSSAFVFPPVRRFAMSAPLQVIDALDRPEPLATIGTEWELIEDRVMGGQSAGAMTRELVAGRPALHLTGDVSLENNGGFIQVALDLSPDGSSVDVSAWSGLEIDVVGNGETYNLHLRTADVQRPWQSYRQSFVALPEWRSVRLPFADFEPHRIDASLDLTRVRRLGIVAIGRAFSVDIAIGGIRFYS